MKAERQVNTIGILSARLSGGMGISYEFRIQMENTGTDRFQHRAGGLMIPGKAD